MIFLLAFESKDDQDKFEYLYSKYKNLLLHKAREILKDHMLAEDAVSEAYLRIYRNLHKIDDPASNQAIAFAVTIAKNTALTILSREKAKPAEMYDEAQPDEFDLEGHVLSEMSSETIYAVIGSLGDELRDILLLKFAHDLSHREIADIMNLTENNVTVKLHRAKKKLAEILVKGGYTRG